MDEFIKVLSAKIEDMNMERQELRQMLTEALVLLVRAAQDLKALSNRVALLEAKVNKKFIA